MDILLVLQYIASIAVLGVILFGLSRLKKALLRCSAKLQNKPPSPA